MTSTPEHNPAKWLNSLIKPYISDRYSLVSTSTFIEKIKELKPTKDRRCHRRLVRHLNSIRASTNQDQGPGSILLPPRAASLTRLDAGSGGVRPTSSCVIQNLQT